MYFHVHTPPVCSHLHSSAWSPRSAVKSRFRSFVPIRGIRLFPLLPAYGHFLHSFAIFREVSRSFAILPHPPPLGLLDLCRTSPVLGSVSEQESLARRSIVPLVTHFYCS